MRVTIEVKHVLFSFESFEEWANWAQRKYRNCGVPPHCCLAIDKGGNICTIGKHWMNARDLNLFPVIVYEVADR